jgi:hypothetical protein
MEEEAASSTPRASSRPAPGAAVVRSVLQHTPTQTSRASRAAPGALSAARELLRHPPSSTASPGAMKQWRDDVDRLLSMAHSGSARPRPRSSRRQHEASASVCSPSVKAAQTDDLRAELNRRRAGEDAPVSLERPDDLRAELNRRRASHLPEKYDGTSNLSEFLQVYITTITAIGGDTAVMATYFHVALSGPTRTWLMNLAPGSIYSWEELYARFTENFASAYQQLGVEAHLHAVRQEPGETLRAFISRFTKVRGTIPRISDASIITAFPPGGT